MSRHVLDIGVIFKWEALILLAYFSIDMRFHEDFFHLVWKGNDEAPATKLVMAFFSSRALIIKDYVIFGVMFEREDVSIWLKSKELGRGNDQTAIISWIQEI